MMLMIGVVLLPTDVLAFQVKSKTPHDYKDGLLDDNLAVRYNDLPEVWYDNDTTNNAYNSSTEKIIEFNQATDINEMYLKTGTRNINHHNFTFVDSKDASRSVRVSDLTESDREGYYTLYEADVVKIIITGRNTSTNRSSIFEIEFFGSYNYEPEVEASATIKGGYLELENNTEPNDLFEIKAGDDFDIRLNPINLVVNDNRLGENGWSMKMSGAVNSTDGGNLSIEDFNFSQLEHGKNGSEKIIDENSFVLNESEARNIVSTNESGLQSYEVDINNIDVKMPSDIKADTYEAVINFELSNEPTTE